MTTPKQTVRLKMLGQPSADPEKLSLPLFASVVRAGFPSPADDYIEQTLDLNEFCIRNPPATYLLRVHPDGDSMIDAGIYPGDIVVVDRSLTPQHGDFVVAAVDQEFTLKELDLHSQTPVLRAHNPNYQPIALNEDQALEIVGVVISLVRKIGRGGQRVRPH